MALLPCLKHDLLHLNVDLDLDYLIASLRRKTKIFHLVSQENRHRKNNNRKLFSVLYI